MATLSLLQRLLLDLIAPRPVIAEAAVSALDPADWGRLLDMVRQHRLGPLLHWQLTRIRPGLPVPMAVRLELAESFRQSAIRALVMRRELVLIHRLLTQAGIPYLAMKGAFLAFHAYPQPGLRPLGDLDILLRGPDAVRAFELLVAAGCVRPPQFCQGTPVAQLGVHKHLPELITASGQAVIDLHSRLLAPDQSAGRCDPSEDPAFWSRGITRPEGQDALCFTGPTDLLLHLVLHSTREHRFENGPLILSDIACLLQSQSIDWAGFWQGAERTVCRRACWLMLRLTAHYWGGQGIDWSAGGAEPPGLEQAMRRAAPLLLQGLEAPREDVYLTHALGQRRSGASRLVYLRRRVLPPRERMAAVYPVSERSPLLYLYYLVHLWRLLSRRLPQYVQFRRRAGVRETLREVSEVVQWLEEPAQHLQ